MCRGRDYISVDFEEPLRVNRVSADQRGRSEAPTRFCLAGLGLYGVTAYAVAGRRREIGTRMALGAAPGSVVRLMLSRVSVQIVLGVVIGGVVSLWASTLIATLLYGLEPRDLTTLIGAAVTLAGVAALAAWLPARRAARIDPAQVLRES